MSVISPQTVPRALIVDDDPDILGVLDLLLTTLGFEVRAVRNGSQALAAVGEFAPRVMLMDLNMPVMDGFEAARRMRDAPGGDRLELIAYSAQTGERVEREIRAAGFDRRLTKPSDLDEMIEAFNGVLGH